MWRRSRREWACCVENEPDIDGGRMGGFRTLGFWRVADVLIRWNTWCPWLSVFWPEQILIENYGLDVNHRDENRQTCSSAPCESRKTSKAEKWILTEVKHWALVDSRKPKQLWTFVFPGQTCLIKTHGYTSLLGFLADLWGTCTFEVNDSTGHSMFVFIWPSMEPPNHAKPDSLLVKLTTQRSGKKGRQPSIYSEYGNLDPREAEQCQERSRRWSQWCISISQGIRSPHVTLMVDVVEESARIAGLGLAPTKNVFERVFCQTFASHAYRI